MLQFACRIQKDGNRLLRLLTAVSVVVRLGAQAKRADTAPPKRARSRQLLFSQRQNLEVNGLVPRSHALRKRIDQV